MKNRLPNKFLKKGKCFGETRRKLDTMAYSLDNESITGGGETLLTNIDNSLVNLKINNSRAPIPAPMPAPDQSYSTVSSAVQATRQKRPKLKSA